MQEEYQHRCVSLALFLEINEVQGYPRQLIYSVKTMIYYYYFIINTLIIFNVKS